MEQHEFSESEYVATVFDASCEVSDEGWAAAAWNSIQNQRRLFMAMTALGDLSKGSILDVGCGHADLYPWLKSYTGQDVLYTGIDISEKMIEAAKRRNDANVMLADLKSYNTAHDWVLAVGPFNLDIAMGIDKESAERLQMRYIRKNIRKMFALAKKGAAFTLTSSSLVPEQSQQEGLYYYNPTDILAFCLTLTSQIALDQLSESTQVIVYLLKS